MFFNQNKYAINNSQKSCVKIQNEVKYRHEYKYPINKVQYEILKMRLESIMKVDSHAEKNYGYAIRSLYFDDLYNTCYNENVNGTDPREKFRIRIYNQSKDRIRLELKRKEAGKTLKKSCLITEGQLVNLINGERLKWEEGMDVLLKKFYIQQEVRGLKPKVIVDYNRIPYVEANGNVRVTLDSNISTSVNIKDFLSENLTVRPIMPKGIDLLEVKFDQFIPDYICKELELNELRQTTYSKYYYCRKFGGII